MLQVCQSDYETHKLTDSIIQIPELGQGFLQHLLFEPRLYMG